MTRTHRLRRSLLAALPAAALLVVAGGGSTAGAASTPTCPVHALASSKGPVDINFWESMTQSNAATLQTLTNKFNTSQAKVHVNLVQQATYTTTWVKYQAGLSDNQLPALVQLTETGLQGVVDTQSIVPAQSCISATHYQTSDFVPRTLAWYKIAGVQEGMPFAVSDPVVYYNKQSFTAAGLNPTSPPTTLAQYVSDAKALHAHNIGTGLVVDNWHVRNWLATANQLFVNHENGRASRATAAAFGGSAGLSIFEDLHKLVATDGAVTNPANGTDRYDNLLGVGTGKYGMTIDTSAALGTVTSLLPTHPNVTLGVGPLPAASTKAHGGVSGGGSGLYISNKVPAAQQAAAWEYETYLDSPASQATWAKGTGYIPIRKSAVTSPTITSLWASNPNFKVAYNQLLSGPVNPATDGSVVGPYLTINKVMVDAMNTMYQRGASPSAALKTAGQHVNGVLSSYNGRIGAG
jgi:sn-glycerol 3-phosphate transport system substrate-binding protein